MRKLYALLFLVPTALFAGDPDIKIPEQTIQGVEVPSPLGELVQLNVSKFDPPEHFVSASYDWVLVDTSNDTFYTRYRSVDENKEIFFGAGLKPKVFKVIVAATYLYADDIKAPTFIKTKTVTLKADLQIGEEKPDPKPDPEPEPGPDPKPDPDPKPKPTPGPFYVIIVEEKDDRSEDTAKILSNVDFLDGLKAKGHKWILYDEDAPGIERYTNLTTHRPALIVQRLTGEIVKTLPLPKDVAGIEAALKEISGE